MRETADIETSSDAYAGRFAGSVGKWMLDIQYDMVRSFLNAHPGARILDVGGGHGQIAIPLAEAGFQVVVLGSDPVCAHRLQALIEAGKLSFVSGSLTDIPFEDRSFDVVVSLRLVPHCAQWRRLIHEMCRVASGKVIFDYPAVESVNCFSDLFFERKKKFEGNTRTWQSYRNREIRSALTEEGWGKIELRKQFFWPMALHRMMKSPGLSKGLEGVAALLGLRCLFGSPVIAGAARN